jgi:hypothetical protein
MNKRHLIRIDWQSVKLSIFAPRIVAHLLSDYPTGFAASVELFSLLNRPNGHRQFKASADNAETFDDDLTETRFHEVLIFSP